MSYSVTNPHLPVLDAVAKSFDVDSRRPLRDIRILAVQHVLGSTLSLFSALEAAGAQPGNICLIAKAYSSNNDCLAVARSRGYRVAEAKEGFRDDLPYEDLLALTIRAELIELSKALAGTGPGSVRAVIIDDGGGAIHQVLREFLPLVSRCAGVEQTTRGINLLRQVNVNMPVANVGRSSLKVEIEAPHIAESMVECFQAELRKYSGAYSLPGSRALLVGYGVVGSLICERLRAAGFDVKVGDINADNLRKAAIDGYPLAPQLPAALSEADVVCSATGQSWFEEDWRQYLRDNVLLVNMGSSDIEFGAWRLRPLGTPISFDSGSSRKLPWKCLYRIDDVKGTVWLVKGGFPINFTGGVDPIPPEKIQVTRGLLFAGLLEAVIRHCPGIFDLSLEIQQVIRNQLL